MIKRVVCAVGLSVLAACAPSLGSYLVVPTIPDPARSEGEEPVGEALKVRVGSFIDARPSQTMAVIDGRSVRSDGSPGVSVQDGFQRYLREAGGNVVLFAAPTLEGEITEWKVKVTPDFPASKARATAKLTILLKSVNGQVLYRANFTGESTASHPWMDEDAIRRLLGEAMGSAIEAAVSQGELVGQISRAQVM
jgi:hypothetical protein